MPRYIPDELCVCVCVVQEWKSSIDGEIGSLVIACGQREPVLINGSGGQWDVSEKCYYLSLMNRAAGGGI